MNKDIAFFVVAAFLIVQAQLAGFIPSFKPVRSTLPTAQKSVSADFVASNSVEKTIQRVLPSVVTIRISHTDEISPSGEETSSKYDSYEHESP